MDVLHSLPCLDRRSNECELFVKRIWVVLLIILPTDTTLRVVETLLLDILRLFVSGNNPI